MSTRMEVEDYLERVMPDMLILCETKWKEEWGVPDIGNEKYNIWMKNRRDKGGGGVMMMVRKNVKLRKVEISMNRSEVIKAEIEKTNGDTMMHVGMYVPPLTNAWTRMEYESMLEETINEMEKIVSQNKNVIIVGDFN